MEQVFDGLGAGGTRRRWQQSSASYMNWRLLCEGADIRYALVEEGKFSAVAARLHEKEMMPASQIYYT